MFSIRAIACFVIFIGCSGCMPFRMQDTPHVTGTVMDARTQQPLAGATLHYENFPKRLVLTSEDGTFDFPPIHTWRLILLGPTDRFYHQPLIARANGYEPAQRDFGFSGAATNQIFLLKSK